MKKILAIGNRKVAIVGGMQLEEYCHDVRLTWDDAMLRFWSRE